MDFWISGLGIPNFWILSKKVLHSKFYAKLKLKHLNGTLRTWSKQEFGNLENCVKAAEDKILECEYNYEVDPSDVNKIELEELSLTSCIG